MTSEDDLEREDIAIYDRLYDPWIVYSAEVPQHFVAGGRETFAHLVSKPACTLASLKNYS